MTKSANEIKAANEIATYSFDRLLQTCTAFRDFAEFQVSARGGYVPTLLVKPVPPRASYATARHQLAVNALADKLPLAGFRVWTGR